jgi:hypothetical protein
MVESRAASIRISCISLMRRECFLPCTRWAIAASPTEQVHDSEALIPTTKYINERLREGTETTSNYIIAIIRQTAGATHNTTSHVNYSIINNQATSATTRGLRQLSQK